MSLSNHRALLLEGRDGRTDDFVTARGEQTIVVPVRHAEACGPLP